MVDLKGAYFSLEDKWYSFVDKVSDKLPFFGKVVDKIEEKNIPSFPVAIAIVIVLILVILFLLSGTGQALTIAIYDENGNPIDSAEVSVFLDGKLVDSRPTTTDGKVTFFLADAGYTIKIDKDGFVSITKENIRPAQYAEEFTLSKDDVALTRAISLKSATGQLVSGTGIVMYTCTDTGEQKVGNYSNGSFKADFSDCSQIRIDSISGYTIVSGIATISNTNNIVLEAIDTQTGTITVSVSGDGSLAGVRVTINGEDGTPVETKTLGEGGVITFENAPTKKYFVSVHDPNGKFKGYQGNTLGEIKELRKNETISFNLVLEKTVSATITVNVKDFDNSAPIIGAEVRLLSKSTQETIDTEITGITGQIIFNVPANSEYLVSTEHPEYIIGTSQNATSNDIINFNLIKATEANSQTLKVKVVDPQGKPIDNVKISLKKLDDIKVGDKTTGADGIAEFYNLEITSYYAYAIKEGFAGVTSNAVQVLPRRENILPIIIDIGNGEIKLSVVDEALGIMPGVNVKAINYFTKEVEEEQTTSQTGEASFTLREDKKIYFIVSAAGYPEYYTTTMNPDSDSTIERMVQLERSTDSVKVKIIGIYSGDSEIGAERIVGQGRYIVKAVVEVPKGTFSEAGFHLRTGKATENTINLMEEDLAKLGNVYSSAQTTTKGTTYSPPNNYAVDSVNLTSGTAKWIEAKWKNPQEGIYEIETELIIDDVNPNSGINLWYRAYAKGASTLRSPTNSNSGHELYASANNYLLVSGATNLCKESFCVSKEVTTQTGTNAGRVQYISNKISASKNTIYTLKANLISRKVINGAVLEIEGKGIQIQEILVNGLEKEDSTSLGTLGKDSFTEIEITFEAISSGTGSLKLKINSSSTTELEENIIVDVKANKKFNLDIIPKQIIPYVNNTMFFEVTDGNDSIKDVLIQIKSNNDVLETIETGSEGLAQYELSSPSIGDIITITASKENYDTIEITKAVDERLLIITPPEISETIKIGETASIETTIILENATAEKLLIDRFNLSGELSSYLDISLNNIEGTSIDVEKDANHILKIKPNATAKKLREPKTITGTIEIITKVDGTNQSYSSELPISVRLSMPGYLDSDKCLKITPGSLEYNTSTSEVTQSVEVENSCTAEGIKVNLFEMEAKLNEVSKFGTINVSGVGFMNTSIGDSYSKIADIFENGSKETLSIRFNPNASLSSGKQTLTMMVRAKNNTEDGEETIETKITLNISMSNLSKCIEVEEPADGIVLDVAGWNMGYNRIINSNLSSYAQTYQGFTNRGQQSMPYGMQQALPFMGKGGSEYEQDRFIIKNNCAVDVEIDLDPDSRINVNEEKFTISANSDATVTVSPGYTLGKYNVGVNAKIVDSTESHYKVDSVSVTVRRLGEIDSECIKTNVSKLTFNSFLYKAEKYKVYNYCYNSGVMLARNNAVSIQCDSPTPAQGTAVPYMQVGMEQIYANQYPITNTYQSYNSYLQPQGCGTNSCSFIAGTRTFNYRLLDQSGGVEELTFEVLPSSQYLPQRRLFDSQRNTYGFFQNLADIRQWATETDARTEVYGNLNVQYSNQYGSTQCMSFPITIEDNWRMLESIDSAINWGDPNAKPQECVGSEEKKALDIVRYWVERGNGKGAIPDSEYRENGVYLHLAEPPAVNIGPSPTNTTYYPQYSGTKGTSSAKNCGLLDSLSDLKYSTDFGGVVIGVETLKKGSLMGNTLGPNLAVSIDRTGIQYSCVYINTTVSAKLRRAINLETAEITWPLKAIVTRPGYVIPSGFKPETDCYNVGTGELDCELLARQYIKKGYKEFIKAYSQCAQSITEEYMKELAKEQTFEGACTTDSTEYGFDKINKTSAEEISTSDAKTYCQENFCNNDMLQLFLLDKYKTLKEKLNNFAGIESQVNSVESNLKLSEIYKLAPTKDLNTCEKTEKYYSGTSDVYIEVDIEKFINEKSWKDSVLNDTPTSDSRPSLVSMMTILNNLKNTDTHKEYFILYNNSGNKYIALEAYIKALEKASDITQVPTSATQIDIVNCAQYNPIKKELLEKIANGTPRVVKLIKVGKTTYDTNEQNAIYVRNNNLLEITKLAQFNKIYNKPLYLTAEDKVNDLESGLLDKFNAYPKGFETTINGRTGPAIYNANIDGIILEIKDKTDASIIVELSDKNEYKKSSNNILLTKAFNIAEINKSNSKANEAIIIDETGYYVRTPVVLTATLHASEPTISYTNGISAADSSLIKWNMSGKIISDTKTGNDYLVDVGTSSVARTLKGIYYYPENGALIFTTENKDGVRINAEAKVFNSGQNASTSTANVKTDDIELNLTMPTLKEIIDLVKKNDYACVAEEGKSIIWNENEILAK